MCIAECDRRRCKRDLSFQPLPLSILIIIFCQRMDSNRGPLVSEALPPEPQRQPIIFPSVLLIQVQYFSVQLQYTHFKSTLIA